VTFEEGTCAAWLHDLLKPHVTQVLVCDPRKNNLTHPVLQRFDVAYVILQVARCKRVPEFVEKEIRAVRPFRALVAVHCPQFIFA